MTNKEVGDVFATSQLVQEVLKELVDINNPRSLLIEEVTDLIRTYTAYLNKGTEIGFDACRLDAAQLVMIRQSIISHAVRLQAMQLSAERLNENYLIQVGRLYGIENILHIIKIMKNIGGRTVQIVDDLFDPNVKNIRGYGEVLDELLYELS